MALICSKVSSIKGSIKFPGKLSGNFTENAQIIQKFNKFVNSIFICLIYLFTIVDR